MSLLGRESVLDCASPLALSTHAADPNQSARGLAQSKTWRPFADSWEVSEWRESPRSFFLGLVK